MIPKKIHYCWFGGNPLPELAVRCMESWRKYCPDYEIVEWNETNFDIKDCDYVREAYEAGKWAFVSDVARLYALVHEGGIYMDTDVEVLRPLDALLAYEAVSGFETDTNIPTGLMACEKGQALFREFLDDYMGRHFTRSDGSFDLTTNVERITKICTKYGFIPDNTLQTLRGFTLLPKDYLCPKDYTSKKVHITDHSLVIHHFNGSWLDEEGEFEVSAGFWLSKILPPSLAKYPAKFSALVRYHGLGCAFGELLDWVREKAGSR